MSLSLPRRSSLRRYYYDQPGSMPGTLHPHASAPEPQLCLIDYSRTNYSCQKFQTPEEASPYLDSYSVSWIDVQGLGSTDTLQRLGQVFGLQTLTLEDIVNVPQRPKVEDDLDYLFIVTHMMSLNYPPYGTEPITAPKLMTEQVSFVLGRHFLLTVQEEPKVDSFETVRQRIQGNKGIIRQKGADYLAYCLIDAIIDGFFPILENYGEQLELLEDEVISQPTPQSLAKIHQMKRDLLTLRRAIWPQRELLSTLLRDGSDWLSEEVKLYLRDCYDHALQVLDMVEIYRELASSLMDVYLSAVGNRMNEVMKTLTVISTIFIPLTFIAGIYGMNFDTQASRWNMPELAWPFGYPLVWFVMIAIALSLITFFWRRGWFHDFSKIQAPKK